MAGKEMGLGRGTGRGTGLRAGSSELGSERASGGRKPAWLGCRRKRMPSSESLRNALRGGLERLT